jgi:hypothetical protein
MPKRRFQECIRRLTPFQETRSTHNCPVFIAGVKLPTPLKHQRIIHLTKRPNVQAAFLIRPTYSSPGDRTQFLGVYIPTPDKIVDPLST